MKTRHVRVICSHRSMDIRAIISKVTATKYVPLTSPTVEMVSISPARVLYTLGLTR